MPTKQSDKPNPTTALRIPSILGVFQAVFNQEVKEIRNILNQIIQ